jgi:hypothetical protein
LTHPWVLYSGKRKYFKIFPLFSMFASLTETLRTAWPFYELFTLKNRKITIFFPSPLWLHFWLRGRWGQLDSSCVLYSEKSKIFKMFPLYSVLLTKRTLRTA